MVKYNNWKVQAERNWQFLSNLSLSIIKLHLYGCQFRLYVEPTLKALLKP